MSLKNNLKVKHLVHHVDQLIRNGSFRIAFKTLEKSLEKLPLIREDYAKIASLYRRLDKSEKSISLLFKFVYPSEKNRLKMAPRYEEIAEYAGALIRLSLPREAERLLNQLKDNDPQKFYFKAFARIHQWDYQTARENLLKYLSLSNHKNPYFEAVAKVNLSDCEIELGMKEEAEKTLRECLEYATKENLTLLRINSLELMAKHYLYHENFIEAKKALGVAKTFLRTSQKEKTQTTDELFLEKYDVVLSLKLNEKNSLERANYFKKSALNAQKMEIVRDLDLTLAEVNQDSDLFHYLYFGSPFESYKEKIRSRAIKYNIELKNNYVLKINSLLHFSFKQKTHSLKYDNLPEIIQKIMCIELDQTFKLDSLPYKMCLSLISDFYRPKTLFSLFEDLYPDENFNPYSTPDKIHQIMRKIRTSFLKNDVPLELLEKNGTYSFNQTPPFKTAVSLFIREHFNKESDILSRLGSLPSFTSRDAAKTLQCSKNSAITILNNLMKKNLIQKENSGPKIRYKLSPL